MNDELRLAIIEEAKRIGANPQDLATVISYETGGTFDPWKRGPTTQWGQHQGFIQMGEPQRKQYGYTEGKSVPELVKSSADYLVGSGYKPGMGLLDMYSIINAGGPGRYNASDAANGGAPGTVADKVSTQMGEHKDKAAALLGGTFAPVIGDTLMTPSTPGLTASSPSPAPNYDYISSLAPVKHESPQQQYLRELYSNPDPGGFFSSLGNAYQNEWSDIANSIQSSYGATPDKNFVGEVKQGAFKKMTEDYSYPAEMLNDISDSVNEQEMARKSVHYKNLLERERQLSNAGLKGTAASMVAAILDPVAIGASLLTEGALAPVIAAAKVGRVGRVVWSAGNAAISNVAAEAAVDAYDTRKHSVSDYALALGAGALLGGAITTFRTRGNSTLGQQLNAGGNKLVGNTGAAGAKQVGEIMPGGPLADIFEGNSPELAGGRFRFDLAYWTGKYDPIARFLSRHLVEDPVGRDVMGNVINTADAVTVNKTRIMHRELNNLKTGMIEPYKEWLSATGRFAKSNSSWIEFGDYLTQFEPGTPGAADLVNAPSYAKKAVAQIDRFYKNWDEMIHNPGKEVGKDLRPLEWGSRDNYRPMMADHDNIMRMMNTYGKARMEKAIAMAMQDAVANLDAKLAKRFAQGYFSRLSTAGYGAVDGLSQVLNTTDRSDLIRFITEDLGWDPADTDVDVLIDRITNTGKPDPQGAVPGRGKRRSAINYNYVAKWDEQVGSRTESISIPIRDLFSKNQILMAEAYGNQVSGHVALARMVAINPDTGERIIDGITSRSEWDAMIRNVEQSMMARNVNPTHVKETVERLQYIYDHIVGRPRAGWSGNSSFAAGIRRTTGSMFVTMMQNMGLYQFQEVAHMPAQTGFKAFFKAIPSMRLILSAKGREQKLLVSELMALTGEGDDSILNFTRHHAHEAAFGETASSKAGRTFDTALGYGKRAVNNISMFNVANSAAHQMTMQVIAQRFTDMALKHADSIKGVMVPEMVEETTSSIVNGKVVQQTVKKPVTRSVKKPRFKEITEKTVNPNQRMIPKVETWNELTLNPDPPQVPKVVDGKPVLDAEGKPVMMDDPLHEWINKSVERPVLDADGKPVMIPDPADEYINVGKKMVEDGFDVVDEPVMVKKRSFKLDDINTIFGRKDADRMRMLGLTDESLADILENISQHGEIVDGTLAYANFEKWDPKARDDFAKALYSWTGRVIQRNDIGAVSKWMTNPMAGMIFQFRSFVAGAFGKQLMHNIHNFDARTYTVMMSQLLGAAGVFALTQKARSLGKDDPEAYMEETVSGGQLTDMHYEKLFWGALGRTGFSSILPSIIDSTVGLAGEGQLFANSRSSQNPSDILFGSPVVSKYNSLHSVISSGIDMAKEGRTPSQPEVREAIRLFGNWLPLTIAADAAMQDLPKFAPKNSHKN